METMKNIFTFAWVIVGTLFALTLIYAMISAIIQNIKKRKAIKKINQEIDDFCDKLIEELEKGKKEEKDTKK